MSRERRGKRDGTGPYKGSYQKRSFGRGRRQQAGIECPWDYKKGRMRRK